MFKGTAYRRLIIAGLLFILILLVGTIGYKIIKPEISLFDGFYMTVITVSTIGFSEIIDFHNNIPGRVFTVFIAFVGIGLLTYLFTNVAALVIEGEINQRLKKRRMEKLANKLKNHYIICGVGSVGENIADELYKTHRDFIFADIDGDRIGELWKKYKNVPGLTGDCTQDDFLNALGVKQAKGIFIATGSDNINIVVCVTAKDMNPAIRVIAECKESKHIKKLERVGADKVISSSFIGGLRMASEMVRPTVTTFLDVMMRDQELNLRVEEVNISEKFSSKNLNELSLQDFDNTLLLAIKEGQNWVFNPKPNHLLKKKSVLVFMTTGIEHEKLVKHFGMD